MFEKKSDRKVGKGDSKVGKQREKEVVATTILIYGNRISYANIKMLNPYTQMMKFRLHDAHIRKKRKKGWNYYKLDLNRH